MLVGCAITHTLRPPTAGEVRFVNLEDETAMVNVVISSGLFFRIRPTLLASRAILVRGVVESAQGAVSLVADQITPLNLESMGTKARTFR